MGWRNNANAWDVKTTANWSGTGSWTGSGDNLFWTSDQVSFLDGTANNTVNIAAGGVQPGTVTGKCTSQNYTFGGVGGISGGTTLTKSGTGILTINTL